VLNGILIENLNDFFNSMALQSPTLQAAMRRVMPGVLVIS